MTAHIVLVANRLGCVGVMWGGLDLPGCKGGCFMSLGIHMNVRTQGILEYCTLAKRLIFFISSVSGSGFDEVCRSLNLNIYCTTIQEISIIASRNVFNSVSITLMPLLSFREDEWLCAALDCLDFLPDQPVVELSRELSHCCQQDQDSYEQLPAGSRSHDGGKCLGEYQNRGVRFVNVFVPCPYVRS